MKTSDASRETTPRWAWAVAGLCCLLLIPVALENHGVIHMTPLHLAGGANHPAQLALAGHRNAHTPTSSQRGAVVAGTTQRRSQIYAGPASSTAPNIGLDLHSGSSTLSTDATGAAGTPSYGPAWSAAGAFVLDTHAASLVNVKTKSASNSYGRGRTAIAIRRSAPASGGLSVQRVVTPQHRIWARHWHRPGPASRVRLRSHPRIYGFYVINLTN